MFTVGKGKKSTNISEVKNVGNETLPLVRVKLVGGVPQSINSYSQSFAVMMIEKLFLLLGILSPFFPNHHPSVKSKSSRAFLQQHHVLT